MNKPTMLVGAAASVGLAGLIGTAAVHATTDNGDGQSSLISSLAERFNLDEDDVKEVFDQARDERHAEREQAITDELNALVDDGSLTQSQVDAIIEKRAELESEREANRDTDDETTSDDRRSQMQDRRAALETWAEENDIPEEYLRYVMGGHGKHGGPGGPHGGDRMMTPPRESSTDSDASDA